LQQEALVIIDEIDAHLHPTWQRRILTLLLQHFPNIQFFVTAHSPLVVGGCLDGEVVVLRKGTNQGLTLFQFQHDFIGWGIEDIYREVFEVEGRDDSFIHFSALSPKKDEIAATVEHLETKIHLNPQK
jgi:hypothetical protein